MIVWSQVGIAGYLVGPVAGGAVAETLSFDWIGIVPLAAAAALGAFALALRGREAPHPDTQGSSPLARVGGLPGRAVEPGMWTSSRAERREETAFHGPQMA